MKLTKKEREYIISTLKNGKKANELLIIGGEDGDFKKFIENDSKFINKLIKKLES